MRILCLIILLIAPLILNAQDSIKTTFSEKNYIITGIGGGMGFSDLHGEKLDKDSYKPLQFWPFGLELSFHFNPECAIVTGVFYEKKGGIMEIMFTDNTGYEIGEVDIDFKFDYLTIPLLFRYTLNGKINYYINAGPFMAKLLKQEWEFDHPDLGHVKTDATDEYQPYDFGITAGIGISKNVSSRWIISAEVRDNYGMKDIINYGYDPGYTLETNSISILIGAAYRFKL